jgi:uncharacterized protein (TIGR03083 family)
MERGEAWTAIDDQRRALLHLLEDLSEREWRQLSLCEGWTVRQVAAHLALQDTTWPAMPRVMLDFIRHGGMNSGSTRWPAVMPCCPWRPSSARSATGSGHAGRHLP